jgi:hypothetical protein
MHRFDTRRHDLDRRQLHRSLGKEMGSSFESPKGEFGEFAVIVPINSDINA